MDEAKKRYNKLLERYNKANEYFNRQDISQEKKEVHLPEFSQVLSDMSLTLMKIKDYTKEEVLEGFKE